MFLIKLLQFIAYLSISVKNSTFVSIKLNNMGLLTPKGKKDDKKTSGSKQKNNNQGSKFLTNKNSKGSAGFVKKGMTGGSQRGS